VIDFIIGQSHQQELFLHVLGLVSSIFARKWRDEYLINHISCTKNMFIEHIEFMRHYQYSKLYQDVIFIFSRLFYKINIYFINI
jgi:hypothetical protein